MAERKCWGTGWAWICWRGTLQYRSRLKELLLSCNAPASHCEFLVPWLKWTEMDLSKMDWTRQNKCFPYCKSWVGLFVYFSFSPAPVDVNCHCLKSTQNIQSQQTTSKSTDVSMDGSDFLPLPTWDHGVVAKRTSCSQLSMHLELRLFSCLIWTA